MIIVIIFVLFAISLPMLFIYDEKSQDEKARKAYIVDCLERDKEGLPHGGFIGGIPDHWDLSILGNKSKTK